MARRLASVESLLAISAVVRKLNRATQFCGSAIVNCPTGGKKKKLNVSVAAIDATDASRNPQTVAIINTSRRYAKPTVVALTGTTRCPIHVINATTASDNDNRSASQTNGMHHPRC